ncbi:unnamed protein product, partial [Musa acuminata var. zebrina]
MKRLGVHPKCLKRSKAAKKTPIKVVYISDPMRVTATAATFRSLVQRLTGRDSVLETTDDSSTRLHLPRRRARPRRIMASAATWSRRTAWWLRSKRLMRRLLHECWRAFLDS